MIDTITKLTAEQLNSIFNETITKDDLLDIMSNILCKYNIDEDTISKCAYSNEVEYTDDMVRADDDRLVKENYLELYNEQSQSEMVEEEYSRAKGF